MDNIKNFAIKNTYNSIHLDNIAEYSVKQCIKLDNISEGNSIITDKEKDCIETLAKELYNLLDNK